MIMIITLCYLACVYIAFKVIKIKLTPVSISVAVLIGVFALGGIVVAWNFSAPTTQRMTVYRSVIPLVASQNTKELIKKVHVKIEQAVKKGDVLYEVEAAPFKFAVDQQVSKLAESAEQVAALEAAVEAAASRVVQAKASRSAAKAELDVVAGMQRDDVGAVSKLKVEIKRLAYSSAQAAVDMARASKTATEFSLLSAKSSYKATEAQLRTANIELDRVSIRAPADGYIMNWQAREGTMTTTVITSAQGTFVDMSTTKVLAVFRQNLLKNVAEGDAVEIAFKSFPNRLITGKVEAILEYTGEGQIFTQGVLPIAADIGSKGFLAVKIALDDAAVAKTLPLGGGGMTAIYTNVGDPFHLITKVTIRMKSFLYNLPT